MKKSPAFQFYPKDFLSDPNVELMDNDQLGAYIRLLCYEWTQEGLPNDQKVLAKLSRLGKKWGKKGGLVFTCFEPKGEKLVHPRLQHERKLQEERKIKMSESGTKGANSRWGGHRVPHYSKMGTPMGSDSSSSSSSSATASAIKEKKEIFPLFNDLSTLFNKTYYAENMVKYISQPKDRIYLANFLKENPDLAPDRFLKAVQNCTKDPFHKNNLSIAYVCSNFSKLENFQADDGDADAKASAHVREMAAKERAARLKGA